MMLQRRVEQSSSDQLVAGVRYRRYITTRTHSDDIELLMFQPVFNKQQCASGTGLQGWPDLTGDSQVESAEDVWSQVLTWSALLLKVWGAPRSSAGVLLAAHCQTLSSSSCIDTAVFKFTKPCNVHRYVEGCL